jgi:cephalosporin hydroxylase
VDLQALSRIWLREVTPHKYAHNFTWLGRPIIQVPQDIMAMQELIWRIQPAAIVETGIAHGGSLIFYASMLELLGGDGFVIGVDIDIRAHNRREIERHPMFKRIRLLEGSSVAPEVVGEVKQAVGSVAPVLLVLDSKHTREHVLAELQAYTPLVGKGSYAVVFDTAIEDLPEHLIQDRPWKKGNSPKSAVVEFLETTKRFEIDHDMDAKLLISVAPHGYLRCVQDRLEETGR